MYGSILTTTWATPRPGRSPIGEVEVAPVVGCGRGVGVAESGVCVLDEEAAEVFVAAVVRRAANLGVTAPEGLFVDGDVLVEDAAEDGGTELAVAYGEAEV